MQDFEKLGVFYLGREYDFQAAQPKNDLILYDSKDMVTHAVCVGMTGSGKTGLCLAILEEAAIDHVPAIVIDPKGDLSNLLLTFPRLLPEDFEPWVNPSEARAKGMTVEEFARSEATRWKKGLMEWGQDGERIKLLRESAEVLVFTPGSNAGLPISIVKSFSVPQREILEDRELLRERISTTVTSLLGLMGISADPLQSREHILLSTILHQRWLGGKDLDLAGLIHEIQTPPIAKIGVLDLESYFPEKERFALAMRLNNLLAAPGFEAWLEGAPLDVENLLHQPDGRPRIAIFSIAHLNDSERMFFTSLLLNQVLGWVRSQPGTTSLRALLYMDEIFGYFPPVANPPSKAPLLTLLKQARAFGLGVVLATQNPVDLDYKGLANAGTWFIGRLQTERDKMRVLEGLEGAAAATASGFDRQAVERMLGGLTSRVFLMNNVHDQGPVTFQVRWALSYLCGPLTRSQIKKLMDPVRDQAAAQFTGRGAAGASKFGDEAIGSRGVRAGSPAADALPDARGAYASPNVAAGETRLSSPGDSQRVGETGPAQSEKVGEPSSAGAAHSSSIPEAAPPLARHAPPPKQRPLLPPEIPQYFLPVQGAAPIGGQLVYRPMLFACGQVYFEDGKSGVDEKRTVSLLATITSNAISVDWSSAASVTLTDGDLLKSQPADGGFMELPPDAGKVKSYDAWKKTFADTLFRTQKLDVWRSPGLKQYSNPGESERDFRLRLQQSAREERDQLVAKLRQKYAAKITSLQERIRRAQAAVDREKEQSKQSKLQSVISIGASILGIFGSRKKVSAANVGRATTAARGVSRSMKESHDVGRAEENVQALERQLAQLEEQITDETDKLTAKVDPMLEAFEVVVVKPKKTNVAVRMVALAWAPHWLTPEGSLMRAWE